MIPEMLHTPSNGEIYPLTIRYYGESEGEFVLYDDDGETFNYEKGEYSLTKLKYDTSGSIEKIKEGIFNYGDISWKKMTR